MKSKALLGTTTIFHWNFHTDILIISLTFFKRFCCWQAHNINGIFLSVMIFLADFDDCL